MILDDIKVGEFFCLEEDDPGNSVFRRVQDSNEDRSDVLVMTQQCKIRTLPRRLAVRRLGDRALWQMFNTRDWPFGEVIRAMLREGITRIEYKDGTVVQEGGSDRGMGSVDLEIPLQGSPAFTLSLSNTVSQTIPEISDSRLHELAEALKPVMRGRGQFYAIQPVHLTDVAFTWEPKRMGPPLALEELGRTHTYHNWGYYGFFKPSLKEVYACVQDSIPEGATHFFLDTSTVQQPGEPLLHKPDTRNPDGYHRAVVTFYRVTP